MWDIIEETKLHSKNLPRKIFIGKKEIFDIKTTARQFNNYFINIGHNLAPKMQNHRSISNENSIKYEGPDLEIKEITAQLTNYIIIT